MRPNKLSMIVILLMMLLPAQTACSDSSQPVPSGKLDPNKTYNITFWHAFPDGTRKEAVEELTQQYKKSNPNVNVETKAYDSYSALKDAIDYAVNHGKPPTIAQMYEQQATSYQRKGNILYPLDIDPDSKKDFYPEFLSDGQIHGDQYMLPFNKSFVILYYNADILQRERIAPPTTLEEFESALNKVTRPDGSQWGLSYTPDVDGWSILYKALAGGNFISDDEKSAEFAKGSNIAPAKQALREFLPLVQANAIHIVDSKDWQNDFISQRSIFALDSTANYPVLNSAIHRVFQFNELPIPAGQGGRFTVRYGTNLVMFSKTDSDNQLAARDYINFLTSKDSNITFIQKTGYVPTRKSAFNSSALQSYYARTPARQAEWQLLSISFVNPSVPAWETCRTKITSAFLAVLTSKSTVDDAFQHMADQCQQALNSG